MSKFIIHFLILFFLVIFQSINLPLLDIFFVRPNFILIYCLLLTTSFSFFQVCVLSFWGGILLDIFSQYSFFYSIAIPLIVFVWMKLREKFLEENLFTLTAAVFFFSFLINICEYLKTSYHVFPWFIFVIQPVLNVFFTPVFFPVFAKEIKQNS